MEDKSQMASFECTLEQRRFENIWDIKRVGQVSDFYPIVLQAFDDITLDRTLCDDRGRLSLECVPPSCSELSRFLCPSRHLQKVPATAVC